MGRSTVDDVINEFVAEAREGIEAVDAKLVRFEQTPDDPALLGDIFRLIHSLKGGSGFLGLMRLQSVTHAAENVLGLYRDGTLAVDGSSVTVILDAVDVVRAVIEGLAETGVEPEGDDAALIARLDRIHAGGASPAASTAALAPPPKPNMPRASSRSSNARVPPNPLRGSPARVPICVPSASGYGPQGSPSMASARYPPTAAFSALQQRSSRRTSLTP